jgi:hypothetical protein
MMDGAASAIDFDLSRAAARRCRGPAFVEDRHRLETGVGRQRAKAVLGVPVQDPETILGRRLVVHGALVPHGGLLDPPHLVATLGDRGDADPRAGVVERFGGLAKSICWRRRRNEQRDESRTIGFEVQPDPAKSRGRVLVCGQQVEGRAGKEDRPEAARHVEVLHRLVVNHHLDAVFDGPPPAALEHLC